MSRRPGSGPLILATGLFLLQLLYGGFSLYRHWTYNSGALTSGSYASGTELGAGPAVRKPR